tara:strand:- start:1847 stop:2353 length:507 start_codon:yes stop_codon:yes gene_type:complete
MIYKPREDSFLLQKHVKKFSEGRVLDMGTGSGIQAVTAAESAEYVLAVDVNPEAVEYARKKGLNVIQSDLFESVSGQFDLIIFNPPYLPEDPDEPEDSRLATTGGKEGSELLLRFLENARKYLVEDGKVLVLVSSLTGDVEELFKGYDYKLLDSEKLFMEKLSVYLLW